jgi:hypothetical protein
MRDLLDLNDKIGRELARSQMTFTGESHLSVRAHTRSNLYGFVSYLHDLPLGITL